jgi:hypothetical protein
MATTCSHLGTADVHVAPSDVDGCHECLATGGHWVHLRLCAVCGHVGCCDASPGRHATAHHDATGHVLIRSFERGEDWWFCYEDDLTFVLQGTGPVRR